MIESLQERAATVQKSNCSDAPRQKRIERDGNSSVRNFGLTWRFEGDSHANGRAGLTRTVLLSWVVSGDAWRFTVTLLIAT